MAVDTVDTPSPGNLVKLSRFTAARYFVHGDGASCHGGYNHGILWPLGTGICSLNDFGMVDFLNPFLSGGYLRTGSRTTRSGMCHVTITELHRELVKRKGSMVPLVYLTLGVSEGFRHGNPECGLGTVCIE